MSRSACAIDKDVVPASFKGVPFLCTEATAEGGRRGAEGEFPFGEDTAYADLGRKIQTYNLTASFRDDDHVGDSHALFMVCTSPGPGMLVHPTRGTVMVACRSVKVKDELEDKAGETTVEMEFVEANMGFGGLLGSIFGIISTGLLAASQTSFMRDYVPVRVSQPWKADVIDTAQRLISITATETTRVLGPDAPSSHWHSVLNMEAVATDDGLAVNASSVDKSLREGFGIINKTVVDPFEKFNIMRRLANAATSAPGNLPAGDAVLSAEAVISRQRLLAAVGMAESAMGRKYVTIDECQTAMKTVMAVFEDEAKAAYAACDNKLYMEITNYSVQFSKMMNDLSYRLPGVIRVNFSGGVHPLVAAYTIYKDAKRHRDLEERNIVDANGRFGPIVYGVSPV
jgi:prophage DNA circulation protein